jgi:chromosome partitioning protein
MALAVSLINMKGGVGKTTLAFNLAWYASYKMKQKVLCVDLDPQSNLSHYLMGPTFYVDYIQHDRGTIVDIFEQFAPPVVSRGAPAPIKPEDVIVPIREWHDASFIHLVPSRLELCWTLKNPTGKDHLLARMISRIGGRYDLILIDCAPTESILTTAAYRASRYIVVPVKPEFLAAIGLPLLVRSLTEFRDSYGNHKIDIAAIVFNDADPNNVMPEHTQSRQDVRTIAEANGWYVCDAEVRHSNSYPRGARDQTPIFRTDYARYYVAAEFETTAKEIFGRMPTSPASQ